MRNTSYALIVIAVLLTVASGILHGRYSGRWRSSDANQELADRLAELPEQFGNWQLQQSHEMGQATQNMLECQGYIYNDYVNSATGELVSVAVLLGPHGPISVHTPEICYSSRAYTALGERTAIAIEQPDGAESQFWQLAFESNSFEREQLKVYYGWTTDGQWQASSNPRISFIGSPYLLKIQLATVLPPSTEETNPKDAGRRFLEQLIPILNAQLFPHERPPTPDT